MDTFIPGFDLDKWSPDKSDLTRWYYDLAKYLRDLPILSEENIVEVVEKYLDEHPVPSVTLTNIVPKDPAVAPNIGKAESAARGDHVHKYPEKVMSGGSTPVSARIVASNTYESPSFWYGLRFKAEANGKDIVQIAITSGGGLFCRWYDVDTGNVLENKYVITSVNGKKPSANGDITIDFPDATEVNERLSDLETQTTQLTTAGAEVNERLNGLETQTTQLTTAVGAINDSLPTKYSAINPPPYPVMSVNGNTGAVDGFKIQSFQPFSNVTGQLPAGNRDVYYLDFVFEGEITGGLDGIITRIDKFPLMFSASPISSNRLAIVLYNPGVYEQVPSTIYDIWFRCIYSGSGRIVSVTLSEDA